MEQNFKIKCFKIFQTFYKSLFIQRDLEILKMLFSHSIQYCLSVNKCLKIKIILKEILNLRGRFCFQVLSLLINEHRYSKLVMFQGNSKTHQEFCIKGSVTLIQQHCYRMWYNNYYIITNNRCCQRFVKSKSELQLI